MSIPVKVHSHRYKDGFYHKKKNIDKPRYFGLNLVMINPNINSNQYLKMYKIYKKFNGIAKQFFEFN